MKNDITIEILSEIIREIISELTYRALQTNQYAWDKDNNDDEHKYEYMIRSLEDEQILQKVKDIIRSKKR